MVLCLIASRRLISTCPSSLVVKNGGETIVSDYLQLYECGMLAFRVDWTL